MILHDYTDSWGGQGSYLLLLGAQPRSVGSGHRPGPHRGYRCSCCGVRERVRSLTSGNLKTLNFRPEVSEEDLSASASWVSVKRWVFGSLCNAKRCSGALKRLLPIQPQVAAPNTPTLPVS